MTNHTEHAAASPYQQSLTAAVAHEHVSDLIRAGDAYRLAADLPGLTGHHAPRRRPAWWLRVTTRTVTPRTA